MSHHAYAYTHENVFSIFFNHKKDKKNYRFSSVVDHRIAFVTTVHRLGTTQWAATSF